MVMLTLAQIRAIARLVKADTTGVVIEPDPIFPEAMLVTIWRDQHTDNYRVKKEGNVRKSDTIR